ncbi:MAG: pyruvate kinase [Candidatus Phytoplasma stylosanthis]|uniref:pyruvate kinase n=1 Tax=Candidatus Phytoplasma stylosanthis TaxID=2798314 RepID=UPI00293B5B62|nr:pyruvate kinase [Candidatus Phytoplasma stylosanthis]MDV3168149.1 pyruvate kinase [Candidatus Phytoplasma stylosanthis]MDV3170711.1 pyruvate kinase [Candidatus Phytoplasma stylosanthis]MDV3173840.1 pyruvate kinase [Candidatus Phytoplasma stylosanthis]MDV3173968.1 pyruvate kinase [Candidatus Phytoplasma stylosanthis]MDV3202658.1 pyruvate kinase [Candidatus Phytoplasma stylosanthis]
MNRIKLISTLGPACYDKEVLKQLVQNGLSVARFNFSHADYQNSQKILQIIKEINKENNFYLSTLLDTKGPEIRTHDFDGIVEIKKNSEIRIAFEEVLGNKDKFSLSYYDLYDNLQKGDLIFIDDGYLTLEIILKDEKNRELIAKAQNTHFVKSRRGVNVPNIKLNIPYISEKDKNDIIFACEKKYDFLALSFVRKAQDLLDVRKILDSQKNSSIKIISKIENQEGLDNLDEIIELSDGVMIARGDLGIEIDEELVPYYQKEIIQKCLKAGKYVIVATQMLESMQKNPRPTKAEISDVYNAVLEGASATMLSGETASGLYPIKAVSTMFAIQKEAEKHLNYDCFSSIYKPINKEEILSFGIAQMCLKMDIDAIVVDDKKYSISLSKFRPKSLIFVKVENISEATSLELNYANIPFFNNEELEIKLNILKKESNKELFLLKIENNCLKFE